MEPFLTYAQVQNWRMLYAIPGWGADKEFTSKSRPLLERLNPPFIPEDEIIIFDTTIGHGSIKIDEVRYPSGEIGKGGFLLATDSRIIFGSVKHQVAKQVSYRFIESLHRERPEFHLGLANGNKMTIKTTVPRASALGYFVIATGNSVERTAVVDREANKINYGNDFLSAFVLFFNEIIDQNRLIKRQLNT